MTLIAVSAILMLDTVAASASDCVSSLFRWALLGLTFFIPYGLMNAEMGTTMGTTYPEKGCYLRLGKLDRDRAVTRCSTNAAAKRHVGRELAKRTS